MNTDLILCDFWFPNLAIISELRVKTQFIHIRPYKHIILKKTKQNTKVNFAVAHVQEENWYGFRKADIQTKYMPVLKSGKPLVFSVTTL